MKRRNTVSTRVASVALALLATVALVAQTGAQQGGGRAVSAGGPRLEMVEGRQAIAGDVLVKFRRPLASQEQVQLESDLDAENNDGIGGAGVRRIHSRRHGTAGLLAFLRAHPDVEYAEPNYVITSDATPNDTSFSSLWGLRNTGQNVGAPGVPGADIGASRAWNVSTGSPAIAVGIIDTGIDYTLPDLAANVWSAPFGFSVNVGGRTITCATGSHGFNAITNSCNPFDDNGHGTHVAGTIGAVGNNSLGVTGVNWTTRLIAAKFLDSSGVGSIANAVNAVEFLIQASAATGANVRVLSNSWSTAGFSQ